MANPGTSYSEHDLVATPKSVRERDDGFKSSFGVGLTIVVDGMKGRMEMFSNRPGTPKFEGMTPSTRGARRLTGAARANVGFNPEKQSPSGADAFESLLAAPVHSWNVTADHGLVAAGVAAAIGSSIFAGYMITRDNSHPMFGGAEHLMLFAQPLGGGSRLKQFGARSAELDYDATGSIRRGGLSEAGDALAAPGDRGVQAPPSSGQVKGYVLASVHNGVAIVRSARGAYEAAPGATLPDAGRVLSIEKRADRWVVVTERGTIAEPPK